MIRVQDFTNIGSTLLQREWTSSRTTSCSRRTHMSIQGLAGGCMSTTAQMETPVGRKGPRLKTLPLSCHM